MEKKNAQLLLSSKLICKVVKSMWFNFKEKQFTWSVSTRRHWKSCFSLLRFAGREDYWCDLFIERCCSAYLNKPNQHRIPILYLPLSRKYEENRCRQNVLLYPLLGLSLDHLKDTAWFLSYDFSKWTFCDLKGIGCQLFANCLWRFSVASMLTSTKRKALSLK